MARKRYGRKVKGKARTEIPYTNRNYQIFGLSVLILIVGYWALAQPPVDGFLTLSLAPVLLVVAYCVLIPIAIIYSGKKKKADPTE